MPVMIGLAGLGVGAATSVAGYANKKAAERGAKGNVLKKYEIPQTDYDNLSLLESRAGSGMSDAARTAYQNNADRGLSTSISAILRGGGDANAIGGLYDNYINGANTMAMYDDKRNLANMDNLISGRQRISNDMDKAYQLNEYMPWANKAQAYAQQAANGNQQMWSGINTAVSGVMGGLNSAYQKRQITADSGNKPFVPGVGPTPGAGAAKFANNGGDGSFDASGVDNYNLYQQAWSAPQTVGGFDPGQKHDLYNMWLSGQ